MATTEEVELLEKYKGITALISSKEVVLKGECAIRGEDIDMVDLESRLNDIRSKTGCFKHRNNWTFHTEWTHPMGRDMTSGCGRSRAYLKMCDLLHRYPELLKGKYTKLRSLHLCESPGNFIAAIADVLDTKPFEFRMNSFNPHYEWQVTPGTFFEDAFILGNEERMFFGENNSGNIFKLTKTDFEKLGKVDLVTADGSFNCTENPEQQEKLVAALLARETFLAINALETGGNLVLKMFTFFLPETQEILQRIIGSFQKVYLRKPVPSKPGNSEVYVIACGFLGEMKIDNDPETLSRIKTAALFFSSKQMAMIEFNLATFTVSQFFKCQINEEKAKVYDEFMELVPTGSFWKATASSKPFFPLPKLHIDRSKLHLSASPFISDAWLRQRRILSIPTADLPENRHVLNPLLAFYDENYPSYDFCELQHLNNGQNRVVGSSSDSPVLVFSPWIQSKPDLLCRLMLILSDAEKVIIETPTNINCGILSRFSISVMAILLDSFEVDGLPNPGSVILLKRKRNFSEIVLKFLEDVLRQQRISEVICFIPLGDLSENFRMLMRFYNGYNFYC